MLNSLLKIRCFKGFTRIVPPDFRFEVWISIHMVNSDMNFRVFYRKLWPFEHMKRWWIGRCKIRKTLTCSCRMILRRLPPAHKSLRCAGQWRLSTWWNHNWSSFNSSWIIHHIRLLRDGIHCAAQNAPREYHVLMAKRTSACRAAQTRVSQQRANLGISVQKWTKTWHGRSKLRNQFHCLFSMRYYRSNTY